MIALELIAAADNGTLGSLQIDADFLEQSEQPRSHPAVERCTDVSNSQSGVPDPGSQMLELGICACTIAQSPRRGDSTLALVWDGAPE